MKFPIATETMIEKCEARLEALTTELATLLNRQDTGEWRKDLAEQLNSLATEILKTRIRGDEISKRLYDLKSLAKAEGVEYDIRNKRGEIKKVKHHLALSRATNKTSFTVDSEDKFFMSIIDPPETDEED